MPAAEACVLQLSEARESHLSVTRFVGAASQTECVSIIAQVAGVLKLCQLPILLKEGSAVRGRQDIVLSTKRVKYKFAIRRNLTILRGAAPRARRRSTGSSLGGSVER